MHSLLPVAARFKRNTELKSHRKRDDVPAFLLLLADYVYAFKVSWNITLSGQQFPFNCVFVQNYSVLSMV